MRIPSEWKAERRETVSKSMIVTVAASIAVGFAALTAGPVYAEKASSLLLDVAIQTPNIDSYELKLKITNTSSEPVTIYDTDLPWITPNQLVFVERAYRMDAHRTLLAKFSPMEDYPRTPNRLAPNESLTDTIDLNTMFPSLSRDVRKYDVTVEWSCRSRKLKFTCKEGDGGKFLISKKRTKKIG